LPALESESEYDVDIYTIIFLALAVFIFLRLRSVLGQRTGSERPPYDRAAPNVVQRTQDNNVVPMPGAVIDQAPLAPTADVTPKGEVSPQRQMERAELRDRLDGAIAKLSPEHRAVVLLKEVEGLQYHEIADVVGCSIGTVMSRLFYARKKLQTLLKDLHENI